VEAVSNMARWAWVMAALLLAACSGGTRSAESQSTEPPAGKHGEADAAACAATGEALSIIESAEAAESSGVAIRAERKIEDVVRLAGLAASDATVDTIRDRGIEASQSVRGGDIETAYLNLRSVASACREVGVDVNVEVRELDPRLTTAEGMICTELDAIDVPAPEQGEMYFPREGFEDLLMAVERERDFVPEESPIAFTIEMIEGQQRLVEGRYGPSHTDVRLLAHGCDEVFD